MEIRPPYDKTCEKVPRLNTAWCTYDVVVLAAHNVGLAVAASDTDDADGRAVEAQDNVEALHNNSEQTQEQATGARVGL